MRILRCIFFLCALAAILLLPLIALNLTHTGYFHIRRFREITFVAYSCLLMFVLLRSDRTAFINRYFRRFQNTLESRNFFPVMAGIMLFLYVLAALTRHLSFDTYSHDFSIIDEALYNSCNGRFMFSPVLGKSFFGEHFSPVLILLIPLHYLLRTPYLLVFIQPLALWASVLVLRKILLQEGASAGVSNFACLIYLNNSVMISTLNYLFHMECFLPLLLLSMFWFYRRNSLYLYWTMVILALMVKEDSGLYLLGFSLYITLIEGRRILGTATAVVCLLWSVIALEIIIPHFSGLGEGYQFLSRWDHWGRAPVDILLGYGRHPVEFVRAVFSKPHILLFVSLLFMPFYRRWAWIIFFVPWVINSTSSSSLQSDLRLYYGIPVFTLAVIASVHAFKTGTFRKVARSRFSLFFAGFLLVFNVAHFSYPKIPGERSGFIEELRAIPDGALVQAMSCFYPVLGYEQPKTLIYKARQELTAEYVVLRVDSNTWPISKAEALEIAQEAIQSGLYRNLSSVTNFFILQRTIDSGVK